MTHEVHIYMSICNFSLYVTLAINHFICLLVFMTMSDHQYFLTVLYIPAAIIILRMKLIYWWGDPWRHLLFSGFQKGTPHYRFSASLFWVVSWNPTKTSKIEITTRLTKTTVEEPFSLCFCNQMQAEMNFKAAPLFLKWPFFCPTYLQLN